jgi:hypothetical protein
MGDEKQETDRHGNGRHEGERPDDGRPPVGARHAAEEPWLPMETKLVTYSVITGIVALVVLAILVHVFILEAH